MSAYIISFDAPVSYAVAWRLQQQLMEARAADQIPDTILVLEHTPVITTGNRNRENYLLTPVDELARQGIGYVHTTRGGDVTYHGPGQLVIYPILHLGACNADAHGFLHNLEETAIRTAGTFGVDAFRREGKSGAWTDQGKIAAIGFRLKKWVTCHGMSLNVSVDLSGFQHIVPCGLKNEPVASLASILGEATPALFDVRKSLVETFEDVFERKLSQHFPEDLPPVLEDVLGKIRYQ